MDRLFSHISAIGAARRESRAASVEPKRRAGEADGPVLDEASRGSLADECASMSSQMGGMSVREASSLRTEVNMLRRRVSALVSANEDFQARLDACEARLRSGTWSGVDGSAGGALSGVDMDGSKPVLSIAAKFTIDEAVARYCEGALERFAERIADVETAVAEAGPGAPPTTPMAAAFDEDGVGSVNVVGYD